MKWFIDNGVKTFEACREIAFEDYLVRDATQDLIVAIDYFITSSYVIPAQIGWLVINDEMSLD